MSLLSMKRRIRSRPDRAARPLIAARSEMLEPRTLLASAAVIQWSMLPQILRDVNHGSQPDLPNTPDYVNPPGGYMVLLDASHSVGILPTTTFAWTVTNAQGQSTPLTGEDPSIGLAQGSFTVKLQASGLANTSQPLVATSPVTVKDVLIVSIGDSYASGEGNPVVPGFYGLEAPQWAYSPDPEMEFQNMNAHRSTIAGPAQFALQLQEADPQEAVTFVSVANSGASIARGILGPMPSIGDPNYQLPPEITELQQIIGTRHIDVLTISIGANDIGFAPQVKNLIENTQFGTPSLSTILKQFNTSLSTLPKEYAALGKAVQALNPGQVMITQYPDITRNQNGQYAAIVDVGVTLISKADARFAAINIIAPLNKAVGAAALSNRWTFVTGISSDFRTHGYPSNDSWIRSLPESEQMQDSDSGTFHPNASGHLDIASRIMGAYRAVGATKKATLRLIKR